MALETGVIEEWIYTRLTADSQMTTYVGNRIYADVAPQNSAYPFVLYHYHTGRDIKVLGDKRIMSTAEYYIEVWGATEAARDLEPIDARMDTLLDRSHDVATGNGHMLECTRLAPFTAILVANGITYRRLGGKYAFQAQT